MGEPSKPSVSWCWDFRTFPVNRINVYVYVHVHVDVYVHRIPFTFPINEVPFTVTNSRFRSSQFFLHGCSFIIHIIWFHSGMFWNFHGSHFDDFISMDFIISCFQVHHSLWVCRLALCLCVSINYQLVFMFIVSFSWISFCHASTSHLLAMCLCVFIHYQFPVWHLIVFVFTISFSWFSLS